MRNRVMKRAWLLALCIPTLALAQQERGRGTFEFNAGAGMKMMDKDLQLFLARGTASTRFTNTDNPGSTMPGVVTSLGYNFTPNLGFSLGGEVASGSGVLYLTPIAALTYTVNLNARTSPFVTFGNQITRIVGQNERLTHPKWGAHLGVGVRHMISQSMALRLEGRMARESYQELTPSWMTNASFVGLSLSYFFRRPRPDVVTKRITLPGRVDTTFLTTTDTVRIPVTETYAVDQLVLRVQFKTDVAELLPISRPVLDTIALAIIETPGSRWEVQGHTDNVGTPAYNRDLAQARAQTVLDYLVSQGVNRGLMSAVGFGENRPVFSNTTVYGRAQNRRVQLRRIPPPPTGVPVP